MKLAINNFKNNLSAIEEGAARLFTSCFITLTIPGNPGRRTEFCVYLWFHGQIGAGDGLLLSKELSIPDDISSKIICGIWEGADNQK